MIYSEIPSFRNLQGKRKFIRKIEEFKKSGVTLQRLTEERKRLLVRVIEKLENMFEIPFSQPKWPMEFAQNCTF